MDTWEYHKVMLVNDGNLITILNAFGLQGWEVIQLLPEGKQIECLMKRKL